MKKPKDYQKYLALAREEFGTLPEPSRPLPAPGGGGQQQEPKKPLCEVCGGPSQTQSQSVRHPEPRLLCWPCANEEYLECMTPESRALLR